MTLWKLSKTLTATIDIDMYRPSIHCNINYITKLDIDYNFKVFSILVVIMSSLS